MNLKRLEMLLLLHAGKGRATGSVSRSNGSLQMETFIHRFRLYDSSITWGEYIRRPEEG